MGSAHPTIVPYQCFKTADENFITIAAGNDKLFRNLCKALANESLGVNPKFETNPKRVENRKLLIPILERAFLTKPRDEWLELLVQNDVPAGPVYSISELFSDKQVLHREMLVKVKHPSVGTIDQIGIPMKFSETKPEIKRPPPVLGQDTREVLSTLLGYSETEINKLEQKRVI